jgi:hypothetical protein
MVTTGDFLMSSRRRNNEISSDQAFSNTRAAGSFRIFPKDADKRVVKNLLMPEVFPRFSLEPGDCIFTIGSCFAREIEEYLKEFILPTRDLNISSDLVDGRPNSVINEYNASSIAQRIKWSIQNTDTTTLDNLTSSTGGGTIDLILSKNLPTDIENIMRIRKMIDRIYASLPTSRGVIITLGMTEVWFDNSTGVYLNRLPNIREIRANPTRYRFINMTPDGCYQQMATAIELLKGRGVSKILITVSPVPLTATFEPCDCVIANSYSKSVLRVVADMLIRDFDIVDYFPSYEIVMSNGLNSFLPDHIHVRPEVVSQIMDHLIKNYVVV